MSNGNALNAILVNLNEVFVNETIGFDSPIAGSSIIPYKNIFYALSQITSATPTNPVTLTIAGGQVTDTGGQIKLKPNVNLKGATQGTIINNSMPIILDPSWSSSLNALSYLQDIRINGDLTFDFTDVVGSGNPQFQFNNLYINGNKTVKGTATISVGIYNYGNYFNSSVYDNCSKIESIGNNYSVSNIGSTSTSFNTIFRSFSDTIQLFNSESPLSGSITVSSVILSGTLGTDPILNGTNCSLIIDATSLSSLTPTLTNGATYSLIDYAEAINAGFIPVNYIPADATVKGHLEGIDDALGSESSVNSNVIYQNYANGIDAVGYGSILKPYKTAAYAMSQITTASATNLFTLTTLGGYSVETAQIVTKPYVNWQGETQGTIINNSMPVILDVASWNANPSGYMYRAYLTFTGAVQDDFSTLTNVTPAGAFIQNNTIYIIGNYQVNGNVNNFPFIYNYQSYFDNTTIINADLLSDNNYYFSLIWGSTSAVNSVFGNSTSDQVSTLISHAPTSGSVTSTLYVVGAVQISSLISDGNNSTVYYDASSVFGITPTSTNSGVFIQLDEAQKIYASSTRTNYTPTSTTIEGNLQGIDDALGIITGGTNLTIITVRSNEGSDSVGNGSVTFPYQTIAHAMSVITTATTAKPFLIDAFGNFTESSLALKPNVYINGNGSTISIGTLTQDSSWTGASGIIKFYGFASFTISGSMNLDLSASDSGNNSNIIFQDLDNNSASVLTFKGNIAGTVYLLLDDLNSVQQMPLEIVLQDMWLNCVNSSVSNVTITQSSSYATQMAIIFQACAIYADLSLTSNSLTQPIGCDIYATEIFGGVSATNNVFLFMDSLVNINSLPVLSGGATVTYTSISDGIDGNYIPTNYTAASPGTIKQHLIGINNKLGNFLHPTSPTNVYVSSTYGVDAVGNGGLLNPYATLAYAEAQITSATSISTVTIVILGGILNETATINKKPFINWQGLTQGTAINNTNPIVPDPTTWAANPSGYFYLQDLFISNTLNLDFTSISGSGNPFIQFNNLELGSDFTLKGSGTLFPELFTYDSYFPGITTIDNASVGISSATHYQNLHFGSTSTATTLNFISSGDTIIASVFTSPVIGGITVGAVIDSFMAGNPVITNSLCDIAFTSFALSNGGVGGGLFPVLSGGATYTLLDTLRVIDTSVIGQGYSAITLSDVNQTLSNPCPNYLIVTGDGNANLFLPPMNSYNSLNSKKNHLMVVSSNTNSSWDLATNTGAQTLTIPAGPQNYLVFITSNSSVDGSFYSIEMQPATVETTFTSNWGGAFTLSNYQVFCKQTGNQITYTFPQISPITPTSSDKITSAGTLPSNLIPLQDTETYLSGTNTSSAMPILVHINGISSVNPGQIFMKPYQSTFTPAGTASVNSGTMIGFVSYALPFNASPQSLTGVWE